MKTPHQIIICVRFTLFLLILIFGLVGFGINPASGAELRSASMQSDSPVTISGWITVVWGDGGPDTKIARGPIYYLTEKNTPPVLVEIDKALEKKLGGSISLIKKRVHVQGTWIIPPGQAKKTPIIKAKAIQLEGEPATAISGPQPWISILCKFAGISDEPNPLTYFEGMYGNTYPGLNHYWDEQSYGLVNVNGSSAAGWFTLPQPRSYYVYDQNGDGEPELNHGRILDDCTAVADPVVYFPNFVGINMMFNADLDCCAWGGSGWALSLDGVTQPWNL
ncbi:MAG TPA: hypothetical protein VK206_09500, partial [Anaerolineales bacterium]|nr:hypothetical protein [Anaerolineales bacterium]